MPTPRGELLLGHNPGRQSPVVEGAVQGGTVEAAERRDVEQHRTVADVEPVLEEGAEQRFMHGVEGAGVAREGGRNGREARERGCTGGRRRTMPRSSAMG